MRKTEPPKAATLTCHRGGNAPELVCLALLLALVALAWRILAVC
jgi:hypothetical protein